MERAPVRVPRLSSKPWGLTAALGAGPTPPTALWACASQAEEAPAIQNRGSGCRGLAPETWSRGGLPLDRDRVGVEPAGSATGAVQLDGHQGVDHGALLAERELVPHGADIPRGHQRRQGTGLPGVGDLLLDIGELGAEPLGGGAELERWCQGSRARCSRGITPRPAGRPR